MARLRDSGQGSLVLLMLGLIVAGSVLVGVIGGPVSASLRSASAWPWWACREPGRRASARPGLAVDRPGPGEPRRRAWRSAMPRRSRSGRGATALPRLDWDGAKADLGRVAADPPRLPGPRDGPGDVPGGPSLLQGPRRRPEHRDEQRPAMGRRVGRRRPRPAGDGGPLVPDPAPGRDPAGRDRRPGPGLRPARARWPASACSRRSTGPSSCRPSPWPPRRWPGPPTAGWPAAPTCSSTAAERPPHEPSPRGPSVPKTRVSRPKPVEIASRRPPLDAGTDLPANPRARRLRRRG